MSFYWRRSWPPALSRSQILSFSYIIYSLQSWWCSGSWILCVDSCGEWGAGNKMAADSGWCQVRWALLCSAASWDIRIRFTRRAPGPALPRAPPLNKHFQAGNIFNPISLCWDDRIIACGHLNTRDTNRYMIDTTNTGSRPHNTQLDDNLKWFMYKLQRSAHLHHFTRSSSSSRCMQTEWWCLDIDN